MVMSANSSGVMRSLRPCSRAADRGVHDLAVVGDEHAGGDLVVGIEDERAVAYVRCASSATMLREYAVDAAFGTWPTAGCRRR